MDFIIISVSSCMFSNNIYLFSDNKHKAQNPVVQNLPYILDNFIQIYKWA